jgi:trimeric autotransporter adhesin
MTMVTYKRSKYQFLLATRLLILFMSCVAPLVVAQTSINALQYSSTWGGYDASGATGSATKIVNVAAGNVSASSTDVVNGSQLYATNQSVAANASSITTLSNSVNGLTNDALFWNAEINGLNASALLWNSTLGGYDASHDGVNQQIHNVAAGTASTDAVNLGQLDALVSTSGNAVQYDNGAQTSVTLGGVGALSPVTLTNVAPGALNVTSTDAVNGSQLYATNQNVQTIQNTESGLQSFVNGLANSSMQYNFALSAYDASRQGIAQRISNVAAGIAPSDAVNLTQLDAAIAQVSGSGSGSGNLSALVSSLGGGATYTSGVFIAPSYAIQGTTYSNVGAALSAVNSNLTTLNGDVSALKSSVVGSTSTSTITTTNSGGQAVTTSTPIVTLGGQASNGPVELRNVAEGQSSNDAANVEQVDVAVKEAESYADTAVSNAVASANNYTNAMVSSLSDQFNQKFTQLNRKLDQECAMGSAMSSMIGAAAGASEYGRVAAGAGLCSGGNGAVAVGYATQVGDNAHLNLGASFSGGQGSIGVGVGWDLH